MSDFRWSLSGVLGAEERNLCVTNKNRFKGHWPPNSCSLRHDQTVGNLTEYTVNKLPHKTHNPKPVSSLRHCWQYFYCTRVSAVMEASCWGSAAHKQCLPTGSCLQLWKRMLQSPVNGFSWILSSLLWSDWNLLCSQVSSSALMFRLVSTLPGGPDGCCPAPSWDTLAGSPANRSPSAGSLRAHRRGSSSPPRTLTPAWGCEALLSSTTDRTLWPPRASSLINDHLLFSH